jgi:hypothetical protein
LPRYFRAWLRECFLIEDAASGVQAAKAGEMAARADDYDLLAAADSDLVVETLDDVVLEALREGRLAKRGEVARRRCRAERRNPESLVTSSGPIARQVFLSSSRANSDQRDGRQGRRCRATSITGQ